jgi:hypothetical protein
MIYINKVFIIIVFIFSLITQSVFAQEEPVITVLDFKIDGVSKKEMRIIISLLSSALFDLKKFVVIDVSERETLLMNKSFFLEDCSDESCFIQAGKLLSADGIVVGELSRLGSKYIFSSKMLDTQTGYTLCIAYGVYPDLDAILNDISNLANKLSEIEQFGGNEEMAEEENLEEPVNGEEEVSVIEEEKLIPEKIILEEKKPRESKLTDRYFSIGAGFGFTLPVGQVNEIMGIGYTPVTFINYNFDFVRGIIGLGLVTGVNIEKATEVIPEKYNLYSIPVALSLSITSKFKFPFYISAGLMGGISINIVRYREAYPDTGDLTTSKFCIAPTFGLGFKIGRIFRLSLNESLLIILFNSTPYVGFSTGIRMEFDINRE